MKNTEYSNLFLQYIYNRVKYDLVTLTDETQSPSLYSDEMTGCISAPLDDKLEFYCTPFWESDEDEISFCLYDDDVVVYINKREILLTGDLHVDFETYKRIVNDELKFALQHS
jgi:hypothetical protein